MKRLALILVMLTAMPAAIGEESGHTFDGHYDWQANNESGKVEAVFQPTGEGTWEVSFRFDYRGDYHVFRGTAEGSLSDGKLSGEVFNGRGTRKFSFRGLVKNGRFRGRHFEITGGPRRKTGMLTMNAVASSD